MLHPEGEGLVALRVLAQDGHEEVARHEQSLGGGHEQLVGAVDGAALAHIECVAKLRPVPGAHLPLHLGPQTGVELVELRLHVGEEERLVVGLEAAQTVGRGADVAVVESAPPEGVAREVEHRGDVGVGRILVGVGVVAGGMGHTVAGVHLVTAPALRLLVAVPLHGVVHPVVGGGVHHHQVVAVVLDAGELQAQVFLARGGVGVHVGHLVFTLRGAGVGVVVVAAAGHEEQRQRQQEPFGVQGHRAWAF